MKTLLGILLLVNVALLMWGMGQREFLNDSDAPDAEFHPELMELLPAEKSRPLAKVTIEPTGEIVTTIDEQAVVTTAGPPPVSAAEISQLSEASDDASKIVQPGQSSAAEVAAALAQCMYIGPYATELERSRAGRQLGDMKIKYSDHDDPEGKLLGYRVYQGPFSAMTEVSRARRRLEKQGIKDLYLMNEGKNRMFISLGFFSNEGSATEQGRKFANEKIKTKQRLEYVTYYWLKVSEARGINKLNEKSSIPLPGGIKKIIKPCTELP